ncbi:MAG: ArsR/SmtB family transcription factor [Methanosarcinaceae archaeon]
MKSIVLDQQKFEALSSEIRINILKSLDNRPMTVSELSIEIGSAKSTLHNNLHILKDTGLIDIRKDKRKWVYYELTLEGIYLLHMDYAEHPDEQNQFKIFIVLGIAVVASIGSGLMLLLDFLARNTMENSEYIDSVSNTNEHTMKIVLFFFLILLLYFLFRKMRSG